MRGKNCISKRMSYSNTYTVLAEYPIPSCGCESCGMREGEVITASNVGEQVAKFMCTVCMCVKLLCNTCYSIACNARSCDYQMI